MNQRHRLQNSGFWTRNLLHLHQRLLLTRLLPLLNKVKRSAVLH
jgi:hypothetical protein